MTGTLWKDFGLVSHCSSQNGREIFIPARQIDWCLIHQFKTVALLTLDSGRRQLLRVYDPSLTLNRDTPQIGGPLCLCCYCLHDQDCVVFYLIVYHIMWLHLSVLASIYVMYCMCRDVTAIRNATLPAHPCPFTLLLTSPSASIHHIIPKAPLWYSPHH